MHNPLTEPAVMLAIGAMGMFIVILLFVSIQDAMLDKRNKD